MTLPTLPPDLRSVNVRDFFQRAAAAVPDRPLIIGREDQHTYRDIDAWSDRCAAAWHARGVRKGDRVAVMHDNSPAFVAAWFGLVKVGAVLVAVNTRFKAREVEYLLRDAEVRAVLTGAPYREIVHEAAAGASVADVLEPEELDGGEADFPRPDLVADDLVSLIYTSGTTGPPKGVMQTHGNYVLTGEAYHHWLGLEDGARVYCCLPLFHINAQAYATMGSIGMHGGVVLVERFSASRFWDDVRRHRPDALNYIGAIIAILMKREPGPEERDHSIRIAYGAPTFPDPQRREIEERFGFKLLSGFGMSETTFGLIEDVHDPDRPSSMGRPRMHPHPGFTNEARVVDDDGVDVPDGEVGELLLRNPAIMKGYYGDPERTAQALRDGWLHTGDHVRRDADGLHYFVDRKKDIVRRRGENVSSVEVELVLGEHPSVLEAAIVGVPSELSDEDILAYVIPRPGSTVEPAELLAWCDERLADFKVPRYIEVVDDLPKTPTGKVQKEILRRQVPATLTPVEGARR